MTSFPYSSALILGAGPGISAALTRALRQAGVAVALAARDAGKLEGLAAETGAHVFACDATESNAVERLFAEVETRIGGPEVVVYNASGRVRGPLAELDPAAVRAAIDVTAFGAFLACREAARRMAPKRHGAILFTGASAGVKGFARSAPFAMGKFALRGLAQSAARELGPQGIHVAHIVIDGAVRPDGRADPDEAMLDPRAIAQTYLDVLRQPRSAWSQEVELRPWAETF